MESNQLQTEWEVLAREIEEWQKAYYDEVHSHFAKGDMQRGNAALESWERRFLQFLATELPGMNDRYLMHKSKNRHAGLAMLTVLQNYQRMGGEAIASFLDQLIIDARSGNLAEYRPEVQPEAAGATAASKSKAAPRVFISHSRKDAELTERIVALIRSALNLPAGDIRATSVEGHRLPGGADVDSQLLDEIVGASSLVGLISDASFDSAYVLFELGARWGTQRNLIPLLAPGTSTEDLRGPIAGYNALSCDNTSQLQQFVVDLGNQLELEPEPPNVYQKNIDRVLELAAISHSDAHISSSVATHEESQLEDSDTADRMIEDHCKEQWPDDFRMRAYCEEQQRSALEQLSQDHPDDIPDDAFDQIRSMCALQWPTDFAMRRYCEVEQIKAYRQLKS